MLVTKHIGYYMAFSLSVNGISMKLEPFGVLLSNNCKITKYNTNLIFYLVLKCIAFKIKIFEDNLYTHCWKSLYYLTKFQCSLSENEQLA